MKKATNFYKIGLFTMISLALFIILLLAMGGRSWFSKPIYIETYFNESIQGLEVGSPVKYRGVLIGKISQIDFVNDIYRRNLNTDKAQYFNHYIYVLMAINLNLFSKHDQSHIKSIFNEAIHDGMRVHLAPQGLTGSSYLELDFYNPKNNPPLNISWSPKYPYVPSKLSAFSQITTNLSKVIKNISNADFKKMTSNINATAAKTGQAMDKINIILADQQQNIEASLANMRVITNNLRSITDNAKSYPSSLIFGSKPPKLDLNNAQQKN